MVYSVFSLYCINSTREIQALSTADMNEWIPVMIFINEEIRVLINWSSLPLLFSLWFPACPLVVHFQVDSPEAQPENTSSQHHCVCQYIISTLLCVWKYISTSLCVSKYISTSLCENIEDWCQHQFIHVMQST